MADFIKMTAADVRVGDSIDFMRDRDMAQAHVSGEMVSEVRMDLLKGGVVDAIEEDVIPEEDMDVFTLPAYTKRTFIVRLSTDERVAVPRKEFDSVYILR